MFIKHGCIYRYCGMTDMFIKHGCMILWDDCTCSLSMVSLSMVVSIDIVGSLYMFIKHGCMVLWDDCMFRSRSPHHISVGLFGFAHILIMHKIVYL